jgi:CheY-like chemotaxis protein
VLRLERRVLVVEDDSFTASLIADVLRGQSFEVATASDVIEAMTEVRIFDPDVVLLDISLGHGPSGLDLAFLLHRQHPDIALLFLTKHPDQRTAGISPKDIPPNAGFLRKDMVRDVGYLIASIDSVLADPRRR